MGNLVQYELFRINTANGALNNMAHVRTYHAYVGKEPNLQGVLSAVLLSIIGLFC